MSVDDLESLQETIFWLSQPGIHDDIAAAEREYRDRTIVSGDSLREEFRLPPQWHLRASRTVGAALSARRDMQLLPAKVAAAIVKFITRPLAGNPQWLSKPLRGDLDGCRSARRGDYRVVFRIDDNEHTVVIVGIRHRAHIYRPG